jgi:hypothetical protein
VHPIIFIIALTRLRSRRVRPKYTVGLDGDEEANTEPGKHGRGKPCEQETENRLEKIYDMVLIISCDEEYDLEIWSGQAKHITPPLVAVT